jgi:glycolate oxidase
MTGQPFLDALQRLLSPGQVLTSPADCAPYGRDMSIYAAVPEAVVLAHNTADVQRVMALAGREGVPVTPRGAGTSVTGAVIPVRRGLVLDLSGMNRILTINRVDRYAVVEPGVVLSRLNAALAPRLFFPPDPGSQEMATLGGMISTNASGKNALKYGATGDYVLALEVVLASGEVVRFGHTTPKASAGFDLTRLFVAAEGTLGVITEATLRLLPRPEAAGLVLAGFPSLETAARAAVHILAAGLPLSACELMDCLSLADFSRQVGLDFPDTEALLLLEAEAPAAHLAAHTAALAELCRRHGASCHHRIMDPPTREQVWRLRRLLVSSLTAAGGAARLVPMAEDLGVPVSRVPEAMRRSKELAAQHGVPVVLFGHVGDGNIHTTFIINPQESEAWARAGRLAAELHRLAGELGGTVSAEHGIGLAKAPFLAAELGPGHRLMQEIKGLLDPRGVLNPGKLGFSRTEDDLLQHFAFAAPTQDPDRLRSLGSPRADQGSLLCMMCGCCRAVCPVFAATGDEGQNARGKVHLAYLWRTGQLELSPDLAAKFFLCTDCGACERYCPAGIDVTGILEAMRRQAYEAGLLPPALKAGLRALKLANHSRSKDQQATGSPGAALNLEAAGGRGEILVFPGCAAGHQEPGLLRAALDLLAQAQVPFSLLNGNDACCGLPLLQQGASPAFAAQAARLAAQFQNRSARTLVSPCPGCVRTLGQLYPRVAAGFAPQVLGLPQLLGELASAGKLAWLRPVKKKAIYHHPCLGGSEDDPRPLLRSIPGLELLEFPPHREGALCCGGGGGLAALAPEAAARMAAKAPDLARQLGAELLITACPLCQARFRQTLETTGFGDLVVMDLAEVVLMALAAD